MAGLEVQNYNERHRSLIPRLPDSQWFHIFFVYKTILPDKEIVRKLVENLEDLGYKCGTHENDFIVGKTIVDNVLKCLQKTLTLVILLSKEFCRSEWCKYDLNLAQTLKNKGQNLHIIPLVLESCSIPDIISHVTYLEIDDPIEKWQERFFQSVYDSINDEPQINRSSSSSSICQYCERSIDITVSYTERTTSTFKGDIAHEEELQFQFDEENLMKYGKQQSTKEKTDTFKYIRKELQHNVKYPEFVLLQSRLHSFHKYKWIGSYMPDLKKMAISGFYFADNEDAVRCFQCGIGLKNWTSDDDPVFEHARWSPMCPYIIAKEGQYYIDLVFEAVREVEMESKHEKWRSENRMEEMSPKGLSRKRFCSLPESPSTVSLDNLVKDLKGMNITEKPRKFNGDYGYMYDSGCASFRGSVESLQEI